ncbi:hypothetical protein AMECASPLE_023447 [Ameca splendens]|uniref:Uncharacterized protein n=1 Tax=Ameca splendens TaxID=208324 RepID=A0ABV0XH26_9TELE
MMSPPLRAAVFNRLFRVRTPLASCRSKQAFILKGHTGTCADFASLPPQVSVSKRAQFGGEDVGMLTSARQRFNWKTTAGRVAEKNGLSDLEETTRHVTFLRRFLDLLLSCLLRQRLDFSIIV